MVDPAENMALIIMLWYFTNKLLKLELMLNATYNTILKPKATEHLQVCVDHAHLQKRLWPSPITLDKILYGHTEDLKRMAEFRKDRKITFLIII
jgi:hypothetical protein